MDLDVVRVALYLVDDAVPFYEATWIAGVAPLDAFPAQLNVVCGVEDRVRVVVDALLGRFLVDREERALDCAAAETTEVILLLWRRYRCGDGRVDADEACDCGIADPAPDGCNGPNSDVEPDACRDDCQLPRCGDGVRDSGEACDWARPIDADACTTRCTLNVCGDGYPHPGHVCLRQALGSPLAVGNGPYDALPVDLDRDGAADLLVLNLTDGTLSVLLGDGQGRFDAATGSPFAAGTTPIAAVVALLDGDAHLDVAIANGHRGGNVEGHGATLLFGDGRGGFTASRFFDIGRNPVDVCSGDWNGDGRVDLAFGHSDLKTLSLWLGDGDGGLVAAPTAAIPGQGFAYRVAAADMNADGAVDIVVSTSGFFLWLAQGVGDGRFVSAASATLVSTDNAGLALADLDRDGDVDVAVASQNEDKVSVLLNDGAGALSKAAQGPLGATDAPRALAAADLDDDGCPDLLVPGGGDGRLLVLLGDCLGSFRRAPETPLQAGRGLGSARAVDLNNDGLLDVVLADTADNQIVVLLNDP